MQAKRRGGRWRSSARTFWNFQWRFPHLNRRAAAISSDMSSRSGTSDGSTSLPSESLPHIAAPAASPDIRFQFFVFDNRPLQNRLRSGLQCNQATRLIVSRRGRFGGAVDLGRRVSLVASPEMSAVVWCPYRYLDGPARRWLRIWISRPVVGLAGPMFHFWRPVPVQVRTNTQTYRETYSDACCVHKHTGIVPVPV
jgi:hypothetical protein